MRFTSRHIVIFLSSLLLVACIDTIKLDLPLEKERLVVFGWVTNQEGDYQVTISKTNEFNSTEPYVPVTGATVFVLDSEERKFEFKESGNTGNYYSDSGIFQGVLNDSYELNILTLEGNHIVSEREKLNPLPRTSNVFVQFFLNPNEVNVPADQDNWFVGGFLEDKPNFPNYYRWKIFVNGKLRNAANDLILFDDKFTDGNIFRFDASNVLFMENDKVVLESRSVSALAFNYYKQLKNLAGSDVTGPAYQFFPLKGNLTDKQKGEEILGFFGASEVEIIEVQ